MKALFYIAFCLMLFSMETGLAQMVPPPPPPGGGELWSGITYTNSDGTSCSGCSWDQDDLGPALFGFDLGGTVGYAGYSAIKAAIISGAIVLTSSSEWETYVLTAILNGEGEEACQLAYDNGYDELGFCDLIGFTPTPTAPLSPQIEALLVVVIFFIWYSRLEKEYRFVGIYFLKNMVS